MPIELTCSVRTQCALQAAIKAGADSISCGFQGETSIHNYPGQNFSPKEMASSIRMAHECGVKVYVTVDVIARAGAVEQWKNSIACAALTGADAVVLADLGMLEFARVAYPRLRLHATMPIAGATPHMVSFYAKTFGVKRIVLPLISLCNDALALPGAEGVEIESHIFSESWSRAAACRTIDVGSVLSKSEQSRQYSPLDLVACSTMRKAAPARMGDSGRSTGEEERWPTRHQRSGRGNLTLHRAKRSQPQLTPKMLVAKLSKAGARGLNIDIHQATGEGLSDMVGAFRKAIDGLNLR